MANLNQQGVDYLVSKIYGAIQDVKNTIPEQMVNVTYSELKTLRDSNKLIPGCEYRITDYVTTTTQENTISAGHKFDIIVTALDESTLSEEAKAIQNDNDNYFNSCNLSAWKIWYSLDNDTNRFNWADIDECICTSNCKPFVGYNSDVNDTFCFDDEIVALARVIDDSSNGEFYETLDGGLNEVFTHFGYTYDIYGVKQLTLYSIGIDNGEYEYGNIVDTYHYKGIFTIDGEEYDAWARLVGDGTENIKEGYSGGPSENKIIYTLTNRIVSGEIIYEPIGKGVIYRMIDEWGNDCPYDFKNIMFERGLYDNGSGISKDGDEDFFTYCYTFSWEESRYVIVDASIYGNNGLMDDNNDIVGVYENKIGVYNNSGLRHLNNIVLFSSYGYDTGYFRGYCSNIFGEHCCDNSFNDGFINNRFGNNCCYNKSYERLYNNTFGDNCYSNTFEGDYMCQSNNNIFGNYCSNNKFYGDFYNNTLGGSCYSNKFGYGCGYNTIGNNCSSNEFGYGCECNIFGNNCNWNKFGDYCSHNTFGNNCSYNTFGNKCSNNKFGSSSDTKSYYRYIIFDNGNSYIRLYCEETTGTSKYYQNVRIGLGVNNTKTYKDISDVNVNQSYETLYRPTSSQTIDI